MQRGTRTAEAIWRRLLAENRGDRMLPGALEKHREDQQLINLDIECSVAPLALSPEQQPSRAFPLPYSLEAKVGPNASPFLALSVVSCGCLSLKVQQFNFHTRLKIFHRLTAGIPMKTCGFFVLFVLICSERKALQPCFH